jgi:hypothetical protein
MLNYLRSSPDPIIYDSHDDYVPELVEPEPVLVEEPSFLVANRLSALQWLEVNS